MSLHIFLFVAAKLAISMFLMKFSTPQQVFYYLFLMQALGNCVQGKAQFTKIPSSPLYVASGRTSRFVWNYTVENRTEEFQLSSPAWKYYYANGEAANIGHDHSLREWRWNISFATCPSRLLSPTIRVSKESIATLVIVNVTTNDTGTYGMDLLLKSAGPIKSKVELIVTTWPEFTSELQANNIVFEGRDLNINCSAVGIPLPNITWLLNKGKDKEVKSQGVGYAELFIQNITRHQKGTYQCQANNNPNEYPVENQTEVTVWHKPHVTFLNWTAVEEKIFVLCLANGQPSPLIKWYYPSGMQVESGVTDITGGSRMVLDIPEANSGLYGLYICNASNGVGWQMDSININFTNRPTATTTTAVIEKHARTATEGVTKPKASSEVLATIITPTNPTLLRIGTNLNKKERNSGPEKAKNKINLKHVLLCVFGVLSAIAITIFVIILLRRRWEPRSNIKEDRIDDIVDDSNLRPRTEASDIGTYAEVRSIPIYAQVERSKIKTDKRNDQMPIYAQVDKKKKRRPGQVIYAELEDMNSSTKAPCVLPPSYIVTEYAEIKFPDPIYETLPGNA